MLRRRVRPREELLQQLLLHSVDPSLFCVRCPYPHAAHAQIVLETEVTNESALRLYEALGFVRDKRLPKYYLNGNDAYRLKCWVR